MGAAPAPALAEEITRLAQTATSAAQKASTGGCAETDRAVDALKRLRILDVTLALLVQTQVGKPVRKLSKSSNTAIAAAAKVR